MSYILDALKKNKSSKEEGSDIPDLSSEHAYQEFEEEKPLTRWLWPVVVTVLLLTIGVLIFMLMNPSASQFSQFLEQRVAVTKESDTKPAVSDSEPVKVTQVKPQNTEPAADTIVTTKPVTVGEAVVKRAARPQQTAQTTAQTTNKQTSSQLSDSGIAESGIIEDDLPQLIYTTHIYATQPRDRFVMLNGRAFAEGDTVAKNLTLKEILENDIVVIFKGKEFILPALEDVNIKE